MKLFKLFAPLLLVALLASGALAQNGVVSLDNVAHLTSDGSLSAGNTHQVSIRYDMTDFNSGSVGVIGANGFEVYSPDGADWGYLLGFEGPGALANLSASTVRYLKHFNYDGAVWAKTGNDGADPAAGSTGASSRAGFYLATIDFTGGGWPGSQDNGIAVVLEFTTEMADVGLTLCIDSTIGVCAWEWNAGAFPEFPLWDNGLGEGGPRCFEIADCCQGKVGDANGMNGDAPSLGDVSTMIDAKFITGTCEGVISCLREADVNQSGGCNPTCDDITIGDIAWLIDCLYITPDCGSLGPPPCPNCH